MKLSAKQKAQLTKKYFPLVKKLVLSHLKEADLAEEYADLTIDNATADGKLVGVKMVADDEWYGFESESEFDDFQDQVQSIFDKVFAQVLKEIGKLEFKE